MKLLASVTGPREAEAAVLGGAEIIDLKDPAAGALGAVAPQVLVETIRQVAGRCPVSAVAGDLPMRAETVIPSVSARISADFVKIGLFPAEREARLEVIAALKPLARRGRLVAVFLADGGFDPSLLGALADAGFRGAMIDTMGKGTGGLLKHLPLEEIGRFVASARAHGLMTGLAGSLEAADVPRLAPFRPDYLGFRGALTEGPRDAALSGAKVAEIRRAMDRAAASRKESVRLAAPAQGDLIFVRDMVVPMEIGAYADEYGRRQDVRFSVEARMEPLTGGEDSVADIYSYDVIMDAVRAVAAAGHVVLVETLALRLAETLLADRRLSCVKVRVEKLALGPGAVGIEIERRRAEP